VRGSLFEHVGQRAGDRVTKESGQLLKVRLAGDAVLAKAGSMVAFEGQVGFAWQSSGASRVVQQAVTGETIRLMRCDGWGDVYLADTAAAIHVVHLDGDGLVVNAPNILAFDPALAWDVGILRNVGGATGTVSNITLRGTGWVCLTTSGPPVQLDITAATPWRADVDAVVAWTLGLRASFEAPVRTSPWMRRSSGEGWRMSFEGYQGFVVVQPSELGGFATARKREAGSLANRLGARQGSGLHGGGFGGGSGSAPPFPPAR
jgi:uncharacterized protein (AIM24 family)